MKTSSAIDYISCALFRIAGFFLQHLPVEFGLFLGRRLGNVLYYLDYKHRAIAYNNIKTALGKTKAPKEIKRLVKDFYQNFGSSIIEIFFIPVVDKGYMEKYIGFEGLDNIAAAFKKGKGVIFLGIHAGSWELSNIICAHLGFTFSVLVREQKMPRLNALLNSYRKQKGCKLIERSNQTRQLIEALKNNEAIGLTADQGGKDGTLVKFFGKEASMAVGAIKLALKYDAAILPAYYARIKGPYIKTIIEPVFEVKKTGSLQDDLRENLARLMPVYEKNITKYPRDYLWTYKIWKYSKERKILILSDAKAGHLRQSQAVVQAAQDCLREQDLKSEVNTVEVKFKSNFFRHALSASGLLSGKYSCQGCLRCLKRFVSQDSYIRLIASSYDLVISCGSSLAMVNYLVSQENQARSVVILKPSYLSTRRFDLVIMPQHDKPISRPNVVKITGALNVVNEGYLAEQSAQLRRSPLLKKLNSEFCIGLLIGGDSKNFHLSRQTVSDVIAQVKLAADKLNADILVTTSRRTSAELEDLVSTELKDHARCKLLVIANKENHPFVVGGILGLSSVVVTSPESISMISEAITSRKCVLVHTAAGLSKKHADFLEQAIENKFIYKAEPKDICSVILRLWQNKPAIQSPDNIGIVKQALSKIL